LDTNDLFESDSVTKKIPRKNSKLSTAQNTTEYVNNLNSTEASELVHQVNTVMNKQTGGDKKLDLNKPTVINFWADWCGFSNNFKPHWDKFRKTAESKYKNLQVLDVNVEKNNELNSLAKQLNVEGYPTVVFVSDNKIQTLVSGNKTDADIIKFVESNSSNLN
jgi:thiol-disulfide isomerase/thioredoxin